MLAIDGGKPAIPEPLRAFSTIGHEEAAAAWLAITGGPLSGYLGGERRGGFHVERLERAWEEKFQVRHAIACNSATSGLLMACMAVDVRDLRVYTTPYTMSGTIAPAVLLGADVIFGDIDKESFDLELGPPRPVAITTDLFGHPAQDQMPRWAWIEDKAQSILATREGSHLNGTIGVYSGNIHKAVQCGEGGMCVTNDDNLANAMRLARNHGELAGGSAGLNLRLTEVCAAIWYEQLKKADWIVSQRIEIANALSEAAKEVGWTPPYVEPGCVHSFYIWAIRHPHRNYVVNMLRAEGFPCRAGYTTPLYKLPAFKQDISLPVTEQVEREIICYENCAFTPTVKQLKQIREAFEKVADANRERNLCASQGTVSDLSLADGRR